MNFGKLLEETYRRCGFVRLMQPATGGSATTIVDTNLASTYGEDEFKNDIAFISTTTDGLSPQNKFGIVSAFASDTSTLTIPTVTDAVQSGDVYCIVKHQIPLYEMIAQVNNGLQMLPPTLIPDTSLTLTASTRSYTLPAAVKPYSNSINAIYIGNETYGWEVEKRWHLKPAAAGSQVSLVLDFLPPYNITPVANTIFIEYLGKHSDLSTYSSPISEYYADELVKAVCAYRAWEYLVEKNNKFEDEQAMGKLSRLEQTYGRALAQNPVRIPPALLPRSFSFGKASGY
jgi:hypothetical protein